MRRRNITSIYPRIGNALHRGVTRESGASRNTSITTDRIAARHKGTSDMRKLLPLAFFGLANLLSSGALHAEMFSPAPVAPRSNFVKPFGYGPVLQFLSAAGKGTGDGQCHAMSSVLRCLSVSGGNSCSTNVPAGQLVSCGSSAKPQVDESPFQPVNCNGQAMGDGGKSGLIGPSDFCLMANYMPNRTVDTVYQFTDYVRLGVNRRFGGTITELYGTDKVDRIMQNPGGAMQLSLWAFDPSYADPQYQRAFFAVPNTQVSNWTSTFNRTPYATQSACQKANPGSACNLGVQGPNMTSTAGAFPCAANGATAGSSINPIQGQAVGCTYGASSGGVDALWQPLPGQISVVKTNPSNFTFSNALNGLTWTQTTSVNGPYALSTYKMANNGDVHDMDFQEIPALFLHQGLNKYIYYYNGSSAYQDASSSVQRLPVDQTMPSGSPYTWVVQLPNRAGPFGTGANAFLTEDWVSSCDATETKCFTIATFSSASQDIVFNNDPNGPYFAVHGFFSLTDQLNRTVTVAVFPYRFDDIVGGLSIRQWIYQLHNVKAYQQ